jgi:DNA-binding transcriptional LysR family regulator
LRGILYFLEPSFHKSGVLMDRFDAMSTLIAAVDTGSLSGASRKLGMPLATVSRKVSELESRLRTQLVVRTSRRLLLTEAGRAYVAASRRILDDLEEAERAASGEYRTPRGHLTITAPVMFGRLHVEPVLLDFLRVYPEISARLLLADQVVNLVDDHVDVAVRVGQLADSRMRAVRVGEIRWVACASPHYLETRGEPATPADLVHHDCVMFEGLYSTHLWSFARDGMVETVPIRPHFAVNSADAAISATVASAGITRVLSYQVASHVASGALRLVLGGFEPDALPVHLVHASPALAPLKIRAFLEFAGPRLKASLSKINA